MSWQIPTLSQVADINPRSRFWSSLSDKTEVSFVPMPAVSEFTASIVEFETRTLGEVRRGYTPFQENDVLFAKITPCMENGKAALARGLVNGLGFGSTEFHVLRAKELTLPEYIYYFIRQPHFRTLAKQRMSGAVGQQRVPADFVQNFRIPLPPISEQRRIVEILDQADMLRKKRAEADEKASRILPALFIKMFGDPLTNPKGWEIKTIGDLASVQTGGTPSRKNEDYYGGNISWVKTTEVVNKVIYETEEKLTEKGLSSSNCRIFPIDTIVVAMYGQGLTRGRTAKLGIEASTNQACAAILPSDKFDVDYVWSYLRLSYDRLRSLGRGGNQPNLNLSLVKSFEVPVPPLELQRKFSKVIHDLDEISNQVNKHSYKLETLFQTLLHRALSGELTAEWRKAHMTELLQEMEHQAKVLGIPHTVEYKQLGVFE